MLKCLQCYVPLNDDVTRLVTGVWAEKSTQFSAMSRRAEDLLQTLAVHMLASPVVVPDGSPHGFDYARWSKAQVPLGSSAGRDEDAAVDLTAAAAADAPSAQRTAAADSSSSGSARSTPGTALSVQAAESVLGAAPAMDRQSDFAASEPHDAHAPALVSINVWTGLLSHKAGAAPARSPPAAATLSNNLPSAAAAHAETSPLGSNGSAGGNGSNSNRVPDVGAQEQRPCSGDDSAATSGDAASACGSEPSAAAHFHSPPPSADRHPLSACSAGTAAVRSAHTLPEISPESSPADRVDSRQGGASGHSLAGSLVDFLAAVAQAAAPWVRGLRERVGLEETAEPHVSAGLPNLLRRKLVKLHKTAVLCRQLTLLTQIVSGLSMLTAQGGIVMLMFEGFNSWAGTLQASSCVTAGLLYLLTFVMIAIAFVLDRETARNVRRMHKLLLFVQ